MSNKKNTNHKGNKVNPALIIGAVAIILVVGIIGFNSINKNVTTNQEDQNVSESSDTGSDSKAAEGSIATKVTADDAGNIVINTADVKDDASFYEYDANGTTVAFFAVKAGDGTIRTALNTCQVCKGSPYAYFEQSGDSFQCQNCGNVFSKDMIELEKDGCNPIPISSDAKSVSDSEITIPASYLDDNASIFENWKKF